MSGFGSSRDRDADNPSKQPNGNFDHDAFIVQQQAYGNTHEATKESNRKKKNERTKQYKQDAKRKQEERAKEMKKLAEDDRSCKLAIQDQKREEAAEAAAKAAQKERRKKKLERRNQAMMEGKVSGAAAALAEESKDIEGVEGEVDSGEDEMGFETWVRENGLDEIEEIEENVDYEAMGELVLENSGWPSPGGPAEGMNEK